MCVCVWVGVGVRVHVCVCVQMDIYVRIWMIVLLHLCARPSDAPLHDAWEFTNSLL